MKRLTAVVLAFALIVSLLAGLSLTAGAAGLAENTSFSYLVSKTESGSVPGNMQVELYCKTDPGELITTLGATLVVNTKYVDVVDVDGNAVTDHFKTAASSTPVGDNFGITAYKVGAKKKYNFTSMNALSLVSYNQTSGNLYIFLCGMAAAGLKLPEKSLIASYYLKSKDAAGVPDGAIRLMSESERGTDCVSKAIYVNEISSKKEVCEASIPMTLEVEESLIVQEETTATTKAPETTKESSTAAQKTTAAEKTTAAGKTTEKQSAPTTKKAETTTAPFTTKAVEQMSEKEVEKELSVRIEAEESLTPTEEQAESPAFKAYEKAIEKAKEVLKDDSATVEQKKEVLEQVREAEQVLKAEDAELAAQLEQAEKQLMYAPQSKAMWFYIIGGIIVLIAAVIMVLKLNKKETQEHFR